MKRTVAAHILVFIIGTAFFLSCGKGEDITTPMARKGIINLEGIDLHTAGTVPLKGEWEFFWNRFVTPEETAPEDMEYITVPGAWNGARIGNITLDGNGHATYRLRILSAPRGQVAFKIIYMATAYRLMINGNTVAENGRTGTSRETTAPGLQPTIVYLNNGGDEIDILLHVSNFHHRVGGSWQAIEIGSPESITLLRENNVSLNLFLFGTIFMMFLYNLFLFITMQRKWPSLLYFSLLCFFIALRTLFSGEYYILNIFSGLSWIFINRVEYISFILAVPFAAMFPRSLYPYDFNNTILRIIQGISFTMALFVLVTPSWIYTHTAHAFQLFTMLTSVYVLYSLARSVRRKQDGAAILLTGFILLFLAALNDILHDDAVIKTFYAIPLGLLMFIFSQAFLLSFKFAHTLRDVELLSESLQKKSDDLEIKNITLEKTQMKMEELNRSLEEKVRERTQELAMANEKLENMAHYDQLTGVPNRWLFYDRLKLIIEQSLRERNDFAVFYMDLDGFKEVNDEYGHETGDIVLKELSSRLSALLRKSDTLGRLGGDEFVFLIPGIKESDDAGLTAEKILEAMNGDFIVNGHPITFTASIGISLFPADGTDAEDLVKKADKAMYLAKRSGKNNYIFFKSIN